MSSADSVSTFDFAVSSSKRSVLVPQGDEAHSSLYGFCELPILPLAVLLLIDTKVAKPLVDGQKSVDVKTGVSTCHVVVMINY